MTFWVDLFDIVTGTVSRHEIDYSATGISDVEIPGVHEYYFSEGNMACDCNRGDGLTGCGHIRFWAIGSNNPLFDYKVWNDSHLDQLRATVSPGDLDVLNGRGGWGAQE
jgi:hypothetical protein